MIGASFRAFPEDLLHSESGESRVKEFTADCRRICDGKAVEGMLKKNQHSISCQVRYELYGPSF